MFGKRLVEFASAVLGRALVWFAALSTVVAVGAVAIAVDGQAGSPPVVFDVHTPSPSTAAVPVAPPVLPSR